MGEIWKILLPALLLVIPAVAIYWQFHKPKPYQEPPGCPECHHEAGLNTAREHCDESFDDGWGPTDCTCQNDYHWRYRDGKDIASPAPPPAAPEMPRRARGNRF